MTSPALMMPLPPLAVRPEWFDAMSVRTSRRSYAGVPLEAEQVARLSALCEELSSIHENVRVVFVNKQADDVFSGIAGAYGVIIQGAPAFVAFIAGGEQIGAELLATADSNRTPMFADLGLGRVGEAVVLEATALDLGTCWVAGTFDRARTAAHVALAPGERIRAVTPVGLAADREGTVQRALQRMVRARSRHDLSVIAPGNQDWPAWALEAAEAVRIAPSGKNAQPWRINLEDGTLVLAYATGESLVPTYLADLGIALLHAEIALVANGTAGAWTYGVVADSGEVARFVSADGAAE